MTATITYSWAECRNCLKQWENTREMDAHILGRKHNKETGHKVITEVHVVCILDGDDF
jgi:hypothetical protein